MRHHPRIAHRPALLDPLRLEVAGSELDPAEVTDRAHRTAALVVGRGRATGDPEVTARLVDLVRQLGLATVAQMWADLPARSLPGALWRLYLLHEWVQRRPAEVGRAFTAGSAHAEVDRVVAGVAEPPGPEDLRALTAAILTGIYEGDLAIALERAAAFAHVVAVGLGDPDAADSDVDGEQGRRAARLQRTSADLRACAALWRRGDLV